MDPELLAKLDELIVAQQDTTTRVLENNGVLDGIFNINTDQLIRLNTQISIMENQIFVLHASLIGLSFMCGFFMYWLFKKNFYSFGTDEK